MKIKSLFCFFIVLIFVTTCFTINVSSESDEELFTISGNVYTSGGGQAGDTSIKLNSGDSIWSGTSGEYEITDVPFGEHVIRAYFKDNGHTVSYRKIFVDSDIELDWYEGKNWATFEMFDSSGQYVEESPMSTIKLIQSGESSSPTNGRLEVGPLEIGEYYTARAYYGNEDHSTQYVHFRLDSSSPNDFDFNHGLNSRYGFIITEEGEPISDVKVSNGSTEVLSNDDGFFIFENLVVGSSETFTFEKSNIEVSNPITITIEDGEGWMNASAIGEINYPEAPTFVTETQVLRLSMLPIDIKWLGGNHSLFYTLSSNGKAIYEGFSQNFLFDTNQVGNYELQIGATNSNGTTNTTQKLILVILPEQSSVDVWQPGMSWNYDISYTPTSVSPDPEGIHRATYTVLGKENVIDAYGNDKETFLLRKTDDYYMEREKSYRWVDSSNLLTLKTYWEDDPSSSSYYQRGTMGWSFTDSSGSEINPIIQEGNFTMHFNRTNIIGVPGHPNGYDDTENIVQITHNVLVNTPAGQFSTVYISIIDNNDGIVSWELWYNETAKNWVKIIDRLPGSHAEMVEYNLTSFYMPLNPQFITESEDNYIFNDYTISWAPFEGAESYKLVENGNTIYSGNNTEFQILDRVDGTYTYEMYAVLPAEAMIKSSSITFNISFVPEVPSFVTTNQQIVKGASLEINWEYDEEILWYSLIIEDKNGVKTELYNGTDTSIKLDNLPSGQNRLRVQAKLDSGKITDFSDSIFIKVEDSDEDSPMISIIPILVILVALATINKSRNKTR
tara:strand:- start:7795 stop:10146 length:2352 start_codon:yes stop_codon:yes gene_type:complete